MVRGNEAASADSEAAAKLSVTSATSDWEVELLLRALLDAERCEDVAKLRTETASDMEVASLLLRMLLLLSGPVIHDENLELDDFLESF